MQAPFIIILQTGDLAMKPLNRVSASKLSELPIPHNSLKRCETVVKERALRGLFLTQKNLMARLSARMSTELLDSLWKVE